MTFPESHSWCMVKLEMAFGIKGSFSSNVSMVLEL